MEDFILKFDKKIKEVVLFEENFCLSIKDLTNTYKNFDKNSKFKII